MRPVGSVRTARRERIELTLSLRDGDVRLEARLMNIGMNASALLYVAPGGKCLGARPDDCDCGERRHGALQAGDLAALSAS